MITHGELQTAATRPQGPWGRRAHRLAAENHGVRRAARRAVHESKTLQLFGLTLGQLGG
ncbi:MAG: hypothetical protein ACRD3Y_11240 [Bryobacteraceae bacterium]